MLEEAYDALVALVGTNDIAYALSALFACDADMLDDAQLADDGGKTYDAVVAKEAEVTVPSTLDAKI